MLAQVAYIQKFIMAYSDDEFMPICFDTSAAFVANNPTHLPAGRRAGVGSTHDARPMPRLFGTHITDARPIDAPRRPTMTSRCKFGRPAGLVSSRLK